MSIATNVSQFSEDKLQLLKNTITKNVTDDEFKLFLHACERTQLDPFMRQIYAIKRKSKNDKGDWIETMTIQTGIDGYRLIAERTGNYMPGRECTFGYKENKLFSATAYVKKLGSDKQWHEIASTVFWDEYAAKKNDGSYVGMWRDKPHVMLGKCAEACVLRKAFPADLSGVYTKEEMEQAELTEKPSDILINPEPPKPELAPPLELISHQQAEELELMIGIKDAQYRTDLLKFFGNKFYMEINNFFELPKGCYDAALRSIKKRKEVKDAEVVKEEPVPF